MNLLNTFKDGPRSGTDCICDAVCQRIAVKDILFAQKIQQKITALKLKLLLKLLSAFSRILQQKA